MITDPNEFFLQGCGRCERGGTDDCSSRLWAEGLAHLRRICLDAGLDEVAKWGHPCYTLNGANIAILGAFRGDFHLSFFKASLMKDPQRLFIKRGENTQVASVISFSSHKEVKKLERVLRAYLDEAIAIERAGLKPKRSPPKVELPDELAEALQNDAVLSEAFFKLTPGRQRGYCMTIGSAKQSATRVKRIEKYRPQILAGKGFQE